MICNRCFKNVDILFGGVCAECYNDLAAKYTPKGWICPKCGAVYSPSTSECGRCNPMMPVIV